MGKTGSWRVREPNKAPLYTGFAGVLISSALGGLYGGVFWSIAYTPTMSAIGVVYGAFAGVAVSAPFVASVLRHGMLISTVCVGTTTLVMTALLSLLFKTWAIPASIVFYITISAVCAALPLTRNRLVARLHACPSCDYAYSDPRLRSCPDCAHDLDAPMPPCEHCGYDMRGLLVDRCPECGKAASWISMETLQQVNQLEKGKV